MGAYRTGGVEVRVLSSPVDLKIGRGGGGLSGWGRARVRIRTALPLAGEEAPQYGSRRNYHAPRTREAGVWSTCTRPTTGPWRELVQHSGRVLQALLLADRSDRRRADDLAAGDRGGNRNWDYRSPGSATPPSPWKRSWVAACPDEAENFFDYMRTAAAGSLGRGADLQIMFGIGGERDLSERELRTSPAGGGVRRFAWATAHGTSASSTSTASSWTRSTG